MSEPKNRLLAALPANEYKRISSNLEPFPLVYSDRIMIPGDSIAYVYFPEGGIISLLSTVEKRTALEVGIVGNEGMTGLPVFLGSPTSRYTAVVQGQGTAMRMRSKEFLVECKAGGTLPDVLLRYTAYLMAQISQGAVCFRYHTAEQRLCRWLAMTADRMDSNRFHLTQDFLANMMGVRREAVTRSAGRLQKQGFIAYTRGSIELITRKKIEKMACSCYSLIRKEEQALSR